MVFLRHESDEALVPASPYYFFLPATKELAAYPGTPAETVERELLAAAQDPSLSLAAKKEAVRALGTAGTKSSVVMLKQLLENTKEELRLITAVALLRQNNLAPLPLVVHELLGSSTTLSDVMIHNLAFAVYSGIHDPAAIPLLGQLSHSNHAEARRAAAFALRNTQSSSATPYLSGLLRDPDFDTRYYAVIGLAEITNEPKWRPSEEQFRADEQRYITHWHSQ